jgi:predicted ATPase/DNA-binding winged helix-turn-helix (wHTH) protein
MLVPERQSLSREGIAVRIGGRALDILTALVERAGELVTKRELMERAWSGVFVDESNLKVNMAALRKVLGDEVDAARFIATVPGKGYRFIAPVQATELPGLSASTAQDAVRNNNLPFVTTRIFGRKLAIEAISRDLEDHRLVSIVGPGGIGKTTVALEVAESLLDRYPEGVWLVDLSPLADPDFVPSSIATAIGMTADTPNILATLCEYLRDRHMLILLDSCEHLIETIAACADAILMSAPQIVVLATSRERLRTRDEQVLRLEALDIPPSLPDIDARQALEFSAVQLFVDRASDRLETFHFDDADSLVVAEICRKLDGHPLAIELAATRVGTFGVQGVLQQFDTHFGRALTQRGGPPRHRTLTAMIEWSYALLSETERVIMRRLSVFSAAFDLGSASAVASDQLVGPIGVRDGIANLVDKSLITVEIREHGTAYRQWDTTRSYALDKLVASGEFDEMRRRHAEHFLVMAQGAGLDNGRLGEEQWIDRYTHRLDDLRAAAKWAFGPTGDPELGVRLTVAMIPFWKRLSLAEECRAAAERALDDRIAGYRSRYENLILQQTVGATLLDIQGTVPEARVALRAALAAAESLNDVERQLECLRGLVKFELLTGDSHAALALSERMRTLTDQRTSADAGTGTALEWLGQLTAARDHLDRAILSGEARTRTSRFEFNQHLMALVSMMQVLWMQGFADQAQAMAQRIMDEADASHYAWSYCYAHFQSATLSLHLRDYVTAKRLMDEGTAHAAKHGLTFWRSTVVAGQLCRWKLYTGERVDLPEMRSILADVRERGFRMYYPHLLTNFGEALARQGDLRGGLSAIDEAISLCETTGQIVVIPEILRIKGNVIAWQDPNDWKRARNSHREAIALARRDGTPAWEIRAAVSLVKLSRLYGADAEAEESLATAYGRFTEGFATGDLMRASALLDAR